LRLAHADYDIDQYRHSEAHHISLHSVYHLLVEFQELCNFFGGSVSDCNHSEMLPSVYSASYYHFSHFGSPYPS